MIQRAAKSRTEPLLAKAADACAYLDASLRWLMKIKRTLLYKGKS